MEAAVHFSKMVTVGLWICIALPLHANPVVSETTQISLSSIKVEKHWREKMLAKTLKSLDQLLNWCLGESLKGYVLSDPPQDKIYEFDTPHLREFVSEYGFLSDSTPLVGRVSDAPRDFAIACSLLDGMHQRSPCGPRCVEFSHFSVGEILAKVLAYRDLKVGQVIRIPSGQLAMEEFVVDRIFDLWRGMPAFGLKSLGEGVHSILLFRGTDLSLDSQRGWASVMSDLDWEGPGLGAFQRSQKELHEWLFEMYVENKSARVLGFSLGGALAAYTFIFEREWIAETGSMAFNAPGVSDAVVADWEKLSEEEKKGFQSYVNEGDIVSKVGRLFGEVYQLSVGTPLKPLTAHTSLMCSKPFVIKSTVDVAKENQRR